VRGGRAFFRGGKMDQKKKKKRSSPILRRSWRDKSLENQPKIWQFTEKNGR